MRRADPMPAEEQFEAARDELSRVVARLCDRFDPAEVTAALLNLGFSDLIGRQGHRATADALARAVADLRRRPAAHLGDMEARRPCVARPRAGPSRAGSV